jgi:hypothetical protein
MSAINFALLPDRLHVFADTAVYRGDGTVGAFRSKIAMAAHFPCAITTMGDAFTGMLVRDALIDCASFDSLIDSARAGFHELAGDHDAAVAIGGWSDARGAFELWYARAGAQPLAELPLPAGYGGQPVLTDEQWRRGFGKPMRSAAQILHMEDFAATVLELQREPRDWGKEHPDCDYPALVSLVGGRGELATITKDESSLKTIIQWPDEIDVLIDSASVDWPKWRLEHAVQADPAPAANAPRLSRHERRAAKATVRKVA